MNKNNKTIISHWTSWVRNLPSTEVTRVKRNLALLLKIDEYKFNNYLYRKTEIPKLYEEIILTYARQYSGKARLKLNFEHVPYPQVLPENLEALETITT